MTWQPDGQPKSLMCSQSGILDIARNYGQSVNFSWNNAWSCEDNLALPGGYIGVSVVGYMNGQVCGRSGTYYSNTTTSAWQLWINLCSNPGGSQTFFTQPWEYGWNGINYTKSSGPNSPVRTY